MAVTDKKAHRDSIHAKRVIEFGVASVPINQAGVTFDAIIPFPAAFKKPGAAPYILVEDVQVFCTAIAATATVDIQNGAVSILQAAIVPVAATLVSGVLLAAVAGKLFKPGDQMNLKCTTNGTGTLTNLAVKVTVRAFPMSDEAA